MHILSCLLYHCASVCMLRLFFFLNGHLDSMKTECIIHNTERSSIVVMITISLICFDKYAVLGVNVIFLCELCHIYQLFYL